MKEAIIINLITASVAAFISALVTWGAADERMRSLKEDVEELRTDLRRNSEILQTTQIELAKIIGQSTIAHGKE